MRLKRVVQTLWSVCYPYIFIMMADCFFVIKKRPEEYCLRILFVKSVNAFEAEISPVI